MPIDFGISALPFEDLTRDQQKWYEAMLFCDRMEFNYNFNYQFNKERAPTLAAECKLTANWWESQAKACYARLQRNVPYVERGV